MATVGCAEGIVHINIPKLGERGAESRNLFLGGLEPFELFPFLPLCFTFSARAVRACVRAAGGRGQRVHA